VFWGRVATGTVQAGQRVQIKPSGQDAVVAQVLSHTRQASAGHAGSSVGLVLDRELDASRGDYLLAVPQASSPADAALPQIQSKQLLQATVAWMDDEPLVPGRAYLALHGHRWVKAKLQRIVSRLDINNLQETPADNLPANSIGHIELLLQEPVPVLPFAVSRALGALVLVDTASHKTAGAVLIR
jgi:sulfate adenylyltransferase subunit 1